MLNISIAQNIQNGTARTKGSNAIDNSANPEFTNAEIVALVASGFGVLIGGIGIIGIGIVLYNRYCNVRPELQQQQGEIGCKIAVAEIAKIEGNKDCITFDIGAKAVTITQKDTGHGNKVYVTVDSIDTELNGFADVKEVQDFYRKDIRENKDIYKDIAQVAEQKELVEKAITIATLSKIGPNLNDEDFQFLKEKYQIKDEVTKQGLQMVDIQSKEDTIRDILNDTNNVAECKYSEIFIPIRLKDVLNLAEQNEGMLGKEIRELEAMSGNQEMYKQFPFSLAKLGTPEFDAVALANFNEIYNIEHNDINIAFFQSPSNFPPLSFVEMRMLIRIETEKCNPANIGQDTANDLTLGVPIRGKMNDAIRQEMHSIFRPNDKYNPPADGVRIIKLKEFVQAPSFNDPSVAQKFKEFDFGSENDNIYATAFSLFTYKEDADNPRKPVFGLLHPLIYYATHCGLKLPDPELNSIQKNVFYPHNLQSAAGTSRFYSANKNDIDRLLTDAYTANDYTLNVKLQSVARNHLI